ncbi:MAG: hypothetical protein V4579_09900 [Pseudomonadota bacterium]
MIVVRTDDAGESDFKVFATRKSASDHFRRELLEVLEGAYQRVAVFDVPEAKSEQAAINSVKNADSSIRLLRVEESEGRRMERLLREIGAHLQFEI